MLDLSSAPLKEDDPIQTCLFLQVCSLFIQDIPPPPKKISISVFC